MAKLSQKYEIVVVYSLTLGEEGIQSLIERFKALVEEHGTLDLIDDWGKRRLAYPINDEMDGHYCLMQFTSGPEFPAELDRVLKITDGVLRSLITVVEE